MTVVNDRRNEPFDDKYVQDKIRFRDMHMERVRKALHDKIADDSLENLGKGGIRVPVPKATTHEPMFHHENADHFHKVFPGNVRLEDGSIGPLGFDVGDRIKKGGGGSGGGGNEAGEGEGEDDFIWVSEDEIKTILFEGRQLPDMTKLKAAHVNITERRHSGYTNKGPAHRMDMPRTDKKRKADEMILTKVSERRILQNLSEQFNILARQMPGAEPLDFSGKDKFEKLSAAKGILSFVLGDKAEECEIPEDAVAALSLAVAGLKSKLQGAVSAEEQERITILEDRLVDQFKIRGKAADFHDRHLTFEFDDEFPRPSAKAVMFCQMDVSGSMGQEEKNTAKVFFWLLKEFLKEAYDQVDIVFISHTTEAKEVDEKTFFYGKETGGTLVSSCLKLTKEVIAQRYPPGEWNIYSAQASDGDNVSEDNAVVQKYMEELLPDLQSHYYVEIVNEWRKRYNNGTLSDLGKVFEKLERSHEGKVHVAGGLMAPKDSLEAFKHFFPMGGRAPLGVYSPGM